MKLGIMQPYFFPYLGYFDLIHKTDRWIVFDVVQYNPKSWMNRNRILHPTNGWQYITVPVQKTPRGTLIKDIRIKDKNAICERILGQLSHYKKKAPYFKEATKLVTDSFSSLESDFLLELNVKALKTVCDYLEISFKWSQCSKMNLDLDNVEHAGQWALKIARQLKATTYINPPGGKSIFKQSEWDDAGINLQFTNMPAFDYKTDPYEFIRNLSIIDILMWNTPSDTLKTLTRTMLSDSFSE